MKACREDLPDQVDPYFVMLLRDVGGRLLLAQGDAKAIGCMEAVVSAFQKADVPDLEIPARLELAKAYLEQGHQALAEKCLFRGLRLARKTGYERYVPILNEAIGQLNLTGIALCERDPTISGERGFSDNGYQVRKRLPGGAFGAPERGPVRPDRCRPARPPARLRPPPRRSAPATPLLACRIPPTRRTSP